MILPGILDKFNEQKEALNEIGRNITQMKTEVTRENIRADVSTNVKAELKSFSQHVGRVFASY